MKNCKNCDNKIPVNVVIDGRERNLQNRKYCLDCSPFGLHNTRKLDYIRQEGKECLCVKCNKIYTYSKSKGHTTVYCNSCKVSSRRDKIKKKAIEYKGGSCIFCGYTTCQSALVFHHINPEEKEFGIGSNYNKSWAKIQKELDKCSLLCQNCHAELHEGLITL